MKIAVLIARLLLGLIALVFGLNGFLNLANADRIGRSVRRRAGPFSLFFGLWPCSKLRVARYC